MKWIMEWYCARRLKLAHLDKIYWMDEVERTTLNVSVAQDRIEHWRKRLHEARYPIKKRSTSILPMLGGRLRRAR